MKFRSWSTGVVLLVAALLVSPPSVAAGRHHKHKAKRPAPAAASPQSTPEPADDGEGSESAPSAPEPKSAPTPEPQAPPVRGEPARATGDDGEEVNDGPPPRRSVSRPRSEAAAPPPSDIASTGDQGDVLVVGRREATRLASERIEVATAVGIDVGRREFTYSDPIGTAPRPYLLAAAPLATFELEVYPLASLDLPVLRDLGFRGRVSRAFALDSGTTNGVPLDNSWTRFSGELRGRVLVPGPRRFQVGLSAGVDGSYFDLSSSAQVGALVPAARTLSFSLGADARVRIAGRFSLLVGGAYLATISRGEIYDRFRRPHVAGVDADLAVAVALGPGVEARLRGRYTRYFTRFDPEVGDAAVAGGALDEQTQLGVAFRYAH